MERYAQDICDTIGLPMSWELRLAAMLSQIGCVTLPEGVLARLYAGQTLDEEAHSVYRSHPRVAGKLLQAIPRLEGVAAIVSGRLDDAVPGGQASDTNEPTGTRLDSLILKMAAQLDYLRAASPRDMRYAAVAELGLPSSGACGQAQPIHLRSRSGGLRWWRRALSSGNGCCRMVRRSGSIGASAVRRKHRVREPSA